MTVNHLAIIMDGNGRWASRRLLPRVMGHRKGVDALREITRTCLDKQIRILTVFGFSSENWGRPPAEVHFLMDLLLQFLPQEVAEMRTQGIRFCPVGDLEGLPEAVRQVVLDVAEQTAHHGRLRLNLALNYGGKWDIWQATQRYMQSILKGKIAVDVLQCSKAASLDDREYAAWSQFLCLSDCPPPDLLIRTAGEQRLSNFLLWDLAYSELYFTNTLWPDFKGTDLEAALESYGSRERRFGKLLIREQHV